MTTLTNQENITNISNNDNNNIEIKDNFKSEEQIGNNKFDRFLAIISNKLALSHVVNFK